MARGLERVEVETASGVVYEVEVPLTIFGRLPREGATVELRTRYVVREDSATLYGFLERDECDLFSRLLTASGVGPRLALAMMSALPARRLAQALRDKDVAVLRQVPGVGRKTAERIVLELAERVQDLALASGGAPATVPGAQEAVSGLVALGYSAADAERAVRVVLEGESPSGAEEIIRRALALR